MFDADLRLCCINSAGEDLLSLSRMQVSGKCPDDLWPNSPVFNHAIKRALTSGSLCIERGVGLTLGNSRSIKVDCMITPIFDGGGLHELVIELADANDFTRVLRKENIQTINDAARQSVRGIAHEVKNPLGGIRGAAQLLEQRLKEAELIEYTSLIINEADRLKNFIDRMLAPNTKPEFHPANIHELSEYAIHIIQAEKKGALDIKRDYDPSLPEMQIDRGYLIQVLINLLRNAVQAVEDNGEVTVRTRVLRRVTIQQQLHRIVLNLEVMDNGPGIPPEIENGAFYPMITGRAEGTGLGLPIAQQLIQQHGGIIEYERKDLISYFRVLLPIERINEPQ